MFTSISHVSVTVPLIFNTIFVDAFHLFAVDYATFHNVDREKTGVDLHGGHILSQPIGK